MHAFDASGDAVIHVDCKTKADLQDNLREVVANNSGVLTLNVWSDVPPRQPGKSQKETAAKVSRLSWKVRGTFGDPVATNPAQPVAERREQPAPVDVNKLVEEKVEAIRLQLQLDAANARIKELEADDGDDDDDEQPVNGASGIPATLFGMSGDQTHAILNKAIDGIGALIAGVPAQRSIAGGPVAQPTAMELQVLEAMRRFQAAEPETANAILEQLMAKHGPNATASDGSAG